MLLCRGMLRCDLSPAPESGAAAGARRVRTVTVRGVRRGRGDLNFAIINNTQRTRAPTYVVQYRRRTTDPRGDREALRPAAGGRRVADLS